MAGVPPPGGFPGLGGTPAEEDEDTSFDITLPSSQGPVTVEREGTSYRSLAERYGLPSISELDEPGAAFDLEATLIQIGVNVEDPAVQALLTEPAFQEMLQGEHAPGMFKWLKETYPASPTTAYDDAILASGFTDSFTPPPLEPAQQVALTAGSEAQIARFRKETPNYEENPDTGWIRYKNGVLVSPDGQIAFDPTSSAPGSLKWQRDVVSKWDEKQVQHWADRLVEYGYLSKDQAKKVSTNDPGFLNALSAYHTSRYVYGKPVQGELTGAAGAAEKPPLIDFEDMQAQTRNFVREQYRRVFGEDPTDGEVLAFTDRIIGQAMDLQRRYRRKEYGGYSGMAATEAEERFVERLEQSPEAEFLRESDEENTRLRDSLQQAVVVTNSLAG